jgi:ABC-type branched-subunit amino acid transport system ATPase component
MTNLLDVTGVSKSFGGVRALTECHLTVEEGRIHGLIGPNGSGKTTLFNVMTGYERIQQGEVRFKGTEITNAPPDRVFGLGIGRTFQLTRIFARLSVLENMLVATQRKEGWLRSLIRRASSSAEERRAMELLQFVGIDRLAHDPAGTLSYGQRKLLELASLLVADPAVLLLDEPAGGVNPTLLTHLSDRISELNKAGKTFLVVEHNMEFVMNLCHHVTVLSEGTPLVSGAPDEVRANPVVLDAYLGGEDDPATEIELGRQAAGSHPEAAKPRTQVSVVEPRTRLGGPETLLGVNGVVAGYGGGDILKQVSFDVPEGGITCIVGPNGAGKSTLLATISGLLRPRQGEIRFGGEVISGLSPREILGRGIAHVPQAHSLFPEMTVRENVEMGAFTVRDSALVGQRLSDVEELYPIVRERAHEKAGSLSGGQQRLVEFARSLMLDPAMIVLDEPSMGLDPQTRKIVFDMVELMNRRGKTILLVEQNARAGLKLSTRGVVLENGTVRLAGPGREVLEHPEIGALYLGGAVSTGAAAP